MRISDWSSDVCSSDLLGADPFKLATDPCEPLVRGIFTRADHLDEYLQCREIAGIGDIEMTVVLGMGIEDGVVFPFFLGLVFPVGGHSQTARRSAARRVGNECVRTCSCRWWR